MEPSVLPGQCAAPSVVRIPRSGKHRKVAGQTTRDNSRMVERMRRCAQIFKPIERTLDRVFAKRTMAELTVLADDCARMMPFMRRMDRLARRSKPGVVCWFCENWVVISPCLIAQFERSIRNRMQQSIQPNPDNLVDQSIDLSIEALMNH
jgi:hypothetical protein